ALCINNGDTPVNLNLIVSMSCFLPIHPALLPGRPFFSFRSPILSQPAGYLLSPIPPWVTIVAVWLWVMVWTMRVYAHHCPNAHCAQCQERCCKHCFGPVHVRLALSGVIKPDFIMWS